MNAAAVGIDLLGRFDAVSPRIAALAQRCPVALHYNIFVAYFYLLYMHRIQQIIPKNNILTKPSFLFRYVCVCVCTDDETRWCVV